MGGVGRVWLEGLVRGVGGRGWWEELVGFGGRSW